MMSRVSLAFHAMMLALLLALFAQLAVASEAQPAEPDVMEWINNLNLTDASAWEAAGVAGSSDYDQYKESLCFQEKQRCGGYLYFDNKPEIPGQIDASGYYMSYFDCCGSNEKEGPGSEQLLGSRFTNLQQTAGSCLLDLAGSAIPYRPGVTVGNAYISCDINNLEQCGVDGCEGVSFSMGASKYYSIAKAVSFTGNGRPINCPQYPNNLDNGDKGRRHLLAGMETVTSSKAQDWKSQSSGLEDGGQFELDAHTNAYYDSSEHKPEFGCVGPAFVVTGPITVASQDGKTPYSSGWLTYESFAFNRNDGEDPVNQVDCTVPYSVAQAQGLPVIKPKTYRVTLNKPSTKHYD